MARSLFTLTTDFGRSDHFAGVMKGVILSLQPRAEIIDISHEITPHDVHEAAFVIGETYRYFPPRTIHVVVVDPGVGTERRPLLVEAAGQYFFAPDNGVTTVVCRNERHKARAITAERYFRQPVSRTFHGRDIFAPCAAHLSLGVRPAQFGRRIEDHLKLYLPAPQRTARRVWSGAVVKVDHFGNLITNFRAEEFGEIVTRPFELAVGLITVRRLVNNYAEGAEGEAVLIVGSSGLLEVVVNRGSAARQLGVAAGAPAELTLY